MERRVLNFIGENKLNLTDKDVPTLLNQEILNKWQNGDKEPYYKIQAIQYPIVANGITYEESFFESFINKCVDRPIPGSKSGHETSWGVRPPTDFIMIGGKLEKNGDGTGTVYFKNYIPPAGESGSNEIFLRECQSDMIHFSLVAYCKEIIERDDDGNTTIKITESVRGERNDAVEYETGAMKQVTNSKELENTNRGEGMEKGEILKKINSMRENGDISLKEIADTMSLSDQIITDVHRNALAVMNGLDKLGVSDPVKEIEKLRNQIKENEESVFNSVLTENFGKPGTETEPNYVREYAEEKLKNKSGDELTEAIKELKNSPIAKKLIGDQIDPAVNIIDSTGDKKQNGIETVEY